jgi:trk system potassium uptake protein TrkH
MPSVIATTFQMWKIYVVLTVLSFFVIMVTGLDLWDALNVAFCTISTGVMSIYVDGVSHFQNFWLEMSLIPIMFAYANHSFEGIITDRIFSSTCCDLSLRCRRSCMRSDFV